MASRSRSSNPDSADAQAVRAARRDRRALRGARQRRDRWRSYVAGIRADDVVVFALVTVLSVWGWVAFAIDAEGDVGGGPVSAAAAAALGSLLLVSVRYAQRQRVPEGAVAAPVRSPLLFLPVITSPLLFLVITPPGMAVEGLIPSVNAYGLIGLTAMLMFAGVLAGFLAFGLVVWPVLTLVDAVRPPAGGRGVSMLSRVLSRGELGGFGAAVLATVGWAVAMTAVYPAATGSRVQQRTQTVWAWITLRGEPVPSVAALLLLLVVVGAVAFSVRSRRRAAAGT